MLEYKQKMYEKSATPIYKLKKVEQDIVNSKIDSIEELMSWLSRNHFKFLVITGESKNSDFQFYRPIGKGRYHWRFYVYQNQIIIESHFDRIDPGRKLTEFHKSSEWISDVIGHYQKDMVEEPIHNIIKLRSITDTNNYLNYILKLLEARISKESQNFSKSIDEMVFAKKLEMK